MSLNKLLKNKGVENNEIDAIEKILKNNKIAIRDIDNSYINKVKEVLNKLGLVDNKSNKIADVKPVIDKLSKTNKIEQWKKTVNELNNKGNLSDEDKTILENTKKN